jgi:NAD(P)H-dependent FMN reductase
MLSTKINTSVKVANLAEINLPFFDAELPPSQDAYVIPHESVKLWSEMVQAADGVVFIVPEYNHSLSGIQKNALDWLYKEWAGKPAAFVGYGWHAAENSHATFLAVNKNIQLKLGETFTGLTFMKDINLDGSFIDEDGVRQKIGETLDELLSNLDGAFSAEDTPLAGQGPLLSATESARP